MTAEPLIRLIAALLARLPLRLNHALGACIGWLAWALPTEARRISLANLALCFPDKPDAWRRRVARASLMESGKALTEAPWLWRAGASRVQELLAPNPEAEQILRRAMQEGRGIIFASPHLGSWEFAGLELATRHPITILYRPPRQTVLEAVIVAGRSTTGARLVPADRMALRQMVRAIEARHCLGILPDQIPKSGTGVFAPFFGEPAHTMTLLGRLARRNEIPVLGIYVRRLPHGRGYRYEILRLGAEIYDSDDIRACTALNQAVETLVRSCPEQYAWSYKRFSVRPEGSAPVY